MHGVLVNTPKGRGLVGHLLPVKIMVLTADNRLPSADSLLPTLPPTFNSQLPAPVYYPLLPEAVKDSHNRTKGTQLGRKTKLPADA